MKATTILSVLLAAALLGGGCRVRDVRTATLTSPDLTDAARLAVAEKALRALPDSRFRNEAGSREMCFRIVGTNFAEGTITVRYDSMKIGTKNLEDALARAGFETASFPADPAARAKLPGPGRAP